MAKEKKLKKEEINELKNFIKEHQKLKNKIGELIITKNNIKKEIENSLDVIDNLSYAHKKYMNKLKDKYGEGNIDINKEIFIPNKTNEL